MPVTSNAPPARELYCEASTAFQVTFTVLVVPSDMVAFTASGSSGAVPEGVVTSTSSSETIVGAGFALTVTSIVVVSPVSPTVPLTWKLPPSA